MRDTQRERVYAAERRLYGRDVAPVSIEAARAFVRKIEADRWTIRHYGVRRIDVSDGTPRQRRPRGGSGRIRLPVGHRGPWITLHEVAHCLAGAHDGGWHGPRFARTYLALVRHFLGDVAWRNLRSAFKEEGVRYRRSPTLSTAEIERRRMQMRDLNAAAAIR